MPTPDELEGEEVPARSGRRMSAERREEETMNESKVPREAAVAMVGEGAAMADARARLVTVPCSIADAKAYVAQRHRHHGAPVSGLFALACCVDGGEIVGVAIVGRPVARLAQDGWTAEVTRLCTDGTPNACSHLYAAAWRAARALGWRRLITYTLATEPGDSLRGAGWRVVGEVTARSWSCPSRPRIDRAPRQAKLRWEAPNTNPARVAEREGKR